MKEHGLHNWSMLTATTYLVGHVVVHRAVHFPFEAISRFIEWNISRRQSKWNSLVQNEVNGGTLNLSGQYSFFYTMQKKSQSQKNQINKKKIDRWNHKNDDGLTLIALFYRYFRVNMNLKLFEIFEIKEFLFVVIRFLSHHRFYLIVTRTAKWNIFSKILPSSMTSSNIMDHMCWCLFFVFFLLSVLGHMSVYGDKFSVPTGHCCVIRLQLFGVENGKLSPSFCCSLQENISLRMHKYASYR